MAEFDNTNRGVLFSQEAESDRHPNLTGKIDVNGKEYRLAAWKRTSAAGNQYLSLSVSEPQQQGQVSAPVADEEDSIPF